MPSKISYAGVGAAVAGVIGFIGVVSDWWTTDTAVYAGTADASGNLALAMSIALFAFGGAYVLLSDPQIRRAMGALVSLCAVVLALAGIWGSTRADAVAEGASTAAGLMVSILAGAIGIVAGVLAMREAQAAPEPSIDESVSS
jgi:hypothetical protein